MQSSRIQRFPMAPPVQSRPPPPPSKPYHGRSEPGSSFVLILLTPLCVFLLIAICRIRRPCMPSRTEASAAAAAVAARRQREQREQRTLPRGAQAERPGLGLSRRSSGALMMSAGGIRRIAERQMAAFKAGVEAMPVRKHKAGGVAKRSRRGGGGGGGIQRGDLVISGGMRDEKKRIKF